MRARWDIWVIRARIVKRSRGDVDSEQALGRLLKMQISERLFVTALLCRQRPTANRKQQNCNHHQAPHCLQDRAAQKDELIANDDWQRYVE